MAKMIRNVDILRVSASDLNTSRSMDVPLRHHLGLSFLNKVSELSLILIGPQSVVDGVQQLAVNGAEQHPLKHIQIEILIPL